MQFKIAVIDDDPEILSEEKEKIIQITRALNIPAYVQEYVGAEDFLCDLEDEVYALYIIDVVMPDKNGFELARMIREQDSEVPILFLTDYKQYAIGGYEVRALRYLLKGKCEEEFRKILPSIYEEWLKLDQTYYQYTYRNTVEPIAFSDILYIIMDGRQPVIKTKYKSYYDRKSLKELYCILDKRYFVMIRKNCIVNLKNVKYFGWKYPAYA